MTEQTRTCRRCGWEGPPDARFCGRCGSALSSTVRRVSRPNRAFRLAFFWTGGLITAVALLSSALGTVDGIWDYAGGLWFLGVLIWLLSLVAVPIVLFTLGGRVAAGVLAGIGVGTVALAVTCFANLAFGF